MEETNPIPAPSPDDNTSGSCPRCGITMPSDAPEALCPRCLMEAAFDDGETGLTEGGITTGLEVGTASTDIESLRKNFSHLEIFECLGRGGMGVVYRARQKSLNREVALKILAPERAHDAGFADRFQKEAHALAALNHPNIVTVFDFGESDGHYFLLMEYVDGVNLRQAMSAGRFTPEEALAIVPPICEALEYAHQHGVVHRDIKPENLLLDREGRVKIADFGVAKMMGAEIEARESAELSEAPQHPSESILAGTPRYMAPEQKGDGEGGESRRTDHRVDIYALGVVLYELLTGETPEGELTPPSKRADLDVRLDEIVMRALEAEPELRYATAADFRTRLETVMEEGGASPSGRQASPFDPAELKSAAQRFAYIVLPRPWFESLRKESKEWRYRDECGHERGDVWTGGGIRWKASGNPKRWMDCPACGEMKWFTLYREPAIAESVISPDSERETVPLSRGAAWTWTVAAIFLVVAGWWGGLGLVADQWDGVLVGFRLFALVSAGILGWGLIRRTSRLLDEGGASSVTRLLAPPWLSWVALAFAVGSGLLGLVFFGFPAIDKSVVFLLAPLAGLLGLGGGILSRKTWPAIVAIILGGVNLLVTGVLAMVLAISGQWPERDVVPSTLGYPKAAHQGGGGSSMMRHETDGDLDYAIYFAGEFNSSSAGSQNRHSLSWIENVSLTLKGSGRSFGYLRESANPLFLKINGTEFDLREGRVFELHEDGTVRQLALFPALEALKTVEDLAALIAEERVPDSGSEVLGSGL